MKVLALFILIFSLTANAEDITPPPYLEDALGIGFVSSIIGTVTFKSPDVVLKSKICSLNNTEARNYTASPTSDDLFEEIKYFVKIQETYVKPLMRDQTSSGGEVCGERCQRGKDLQKCVVEMAERRKKAIDRSGRHGFSCFKKFENNFTYLNSDLLTQSLGSAKDSFESQLASINKDRRFECGTKISDTERKNCLRRITQRENNLYAACPQDPAVAARKGRSGGSGRAGTSGSGSR